VETAVADEYFRWRGGYKVQRIKQALSFWQHTILPGIRITLEIEYPFSLLHKEFMKSLFQRSFKRAEMTSVSDCANFMHLLHVLSAGND